MKKIQYLSPSALACYEQSPEQFYLRYLAMERPPEDPQTRPMSVGSAFDAFAKSYLHEKVFGHGFDPRFEFQTLFEAQVQPHVRDFALEAGRHCFEQYQELGALSDLLLELQSGIGKPLFEMEVRGVIDGYREGVTLDIHGVTLLGKPDLFYINKMGAHVIIDWKVNGYCGGYNTSPIAGYVRLRGDSKKNGHHKDAFLMMKNGVIINASHYLEQLKPDWARQLSIYAWLCGCEVGEEFIIGIDQLCCSGDRAVNGKPQIRVAEHRLRSGPEFQYATFALAQKVWGLAHSDHFFTDMSKEDSQTRCAVLDKQAEALRGSGSEEDELFMRITRGQR